MGILNFFKDNLKIDNSLEFDEQKEIKKEDNIFSNYQVEIKPTADNFNIK